MLEQLKETWQGLERRQQISLIVLGALMVGGLVAVGFWATRPTWAVLYSELAPQDAKSVVERLDEQGVAYRLAEGGTVVQVPRERLYELRIQLAGEGVPGGANVGFELFDHSSFSTSDLQNNVNLQRALQGELERSICTLEEIASARVHLALPEERLFSEEQEPPSASVVVGLGASRLRTPQVAAITQLVASAVPALDADAVTVVDTAGRVLTGGVEGAGGMQTMAQLEATRAWEDRVRGHLQTMLDSVLGANRSVVRVQATLDFQSQQITRESFEPPDGQGVVRREEITEESYDGTGASEVGGPAGLEGGQTPDRNGRGSYEHRHETREYDYARLQEQISSPPGTVRR
ncbi:MAG: flagellar M-ring protein FliF, partial [Armatimonadia bacterium]|nr:flagellar M-ring protein FliF [Armatimonadia bacterium]